MDKIKCQDITNNFKYINRRRIRAVKEAVEKNINSDDNPPLKIEELHVGDRVFNLVQEGYLLTGTKQRVADLFVKHLLKNVDKKKEITTLVYKGASNGYGAVATAYAAKKNGLKSIAFLSGEDVKSSRQLTTLHALGASVYLCDTYEDTRTLLYKITDNPAKKWSTMPEYYLVPMGLNDEGNVMTNMLSFQIKKAKEGTKLEKEKTPTFWLVAGSGGILMSLLKTFPNSNFNVLLTGGGMYRKRVIEWSKKMNRIRILKKKEYVKSNVIYSSVKDYDDLIWEYVKEEGKSGDYIWNVSSDDYM